MARLRRTLLHAARRWCSPGPVVVLMLLFVGLGNVTPAAATHGAGNSTSCNDAVLLVIDRSSSMQQDSKLENTKDAASDFLDELWQYQRSGLVAFSGSATLSQPLTFAHQDTKSAVNALTTSGGTSIGSGITLAHQSHNSAGSRYMVVLSDGQSGDDPVPPANAAKAAGITLLSIAVGNDADTTTMQAIASSPTADHYRHATTSAGIAQAFFDLVQQVSCDRRAEPVVQTTAGFGQITITWTQPTGATNYDVCWAATSTGPTWTCATTTATSRIDGSLGNGVTRWYKARAFASTWSDYSVPVQGHTADLPGQVAVVIARPAPSFQDIFVSWSGAPSDIAADYRIEAEVPAFSNTWIQEATGLGTTVYVDDDVPIGQERRYRITPHNAVGWGPVSDPSNAAEPYGPPAPPNLTAVEGPVNGRIDLSWTIPFEGGSAITGYRVYQATNGVYNQIGPVLSSSTTTKTVTGLANGTTYAFAVAAENSIGIGERGYTNGTTRRGPSAPLNLDATQAAANGAIKLTWNAPADAGSGPFTTYKVYRSATATGTYTLRASPGNVLTWTDTGLGNGETWHYKVSGVSSSIEGPQSNSDSARTKSRPDAPHDLQVHGGPDAGQLTLTWQHDGTSGGHPTTEYTIFGRDDDPAGPFTEVDTVPGGTTRYTDDLILDGATRHYYVTATNALGDSDPSNVDGNTTFRRPSPPTSPAPASGPGANQVTVTWNVPTDEGGTPLTQYTVYRASTPGAAFVPGNPLPGDQFAYGVRAAPPPTQLTFTDTLAPGEHWHYLITATNSRGESDPAGPVDAPVPTVPAAPSLSAQTGVAMGTIRLDWTTPNDGGSALTGYNLYRAAPGGNFSLRAPLGVVNSWNDTGLGNGETWRYRVAAENAVGEGPWSNEASATTWHNFVVPSAPQNVTAQNGTSAGEIDLAWDPPLQDGGHPVTAYSVHRGITATNLTFLANATSTTFTDSTVPYGAYRYYAVSAWNPAGEGPRSSVVGARSKDVPSPPLGLTARQNLTSVELAWSPPMRDGGLPLTQYTIYGRSDRSGPFSFVDSVGATALSYSAQPCLQECFYVVTASNAAGEGNRSNIASTTGLGGGFPPEAKAGTTPFSGGALKDAFPCPTSRDGSVNLVTGQFLGGACLLFIGSETGLDVSIEVTHRSSTGQAGLAGANWDLSVARRLHVLADGDVLLQDGYGRLDRYELDTASSLFSSPPGFYDVLRQVPGGYELESPLGVTEAFTAVGLRSSIEDAVGNRVTFTYDARDRPIQIVDSHDRRIDLTYWDDHLNVVSDFMGRATVLRYDAEDNLRSIELPDGATHVFTYTNNSLASARDAKGQMYLENTYDSEGRVVAQVHGDGTYFFAYDPANRTTAAVDPNANGAVWTYRSFEEPVPVRVEVFANRDVSPTDGESTVTTFEHNAHLELARATFPDGNAVEYDYDEDQPDPRGQGNVLAQRQVSSANVPPLATTYEYEDAFFALRSITSPVGNDPDHAPANGTNFPGRYTTTYWYGQDETTLGQDLNGDNLTGWPPARVVRIEHPTADPNATSSQPRVETFRYDAAGRVIRHDDAVGTITVMTYRPSNGVPHDAGDREGYTHNTSVYSTWPGTPESIIGFDYDAAGNVIHYTDAAGASYDLEVDDLNRLTRLVGPASASSEVLYTYDENGNVVERRSTDSRRNPNGSYATNPSHPYFTDTFAYDILDNVVDAWLESSGSNGAGAMAMAAPPGTAANARHESYAYDRNGNLVLSRSHASAEGIDPEAAVTRIYDERNRIVSTTRGGKLDQFERLAANSGVDASDIQDPFTLYLRSDLLSDSDGDRIGHPLDPQPPAGNWSLVGSPQLAWSLLRQAQGAGAPPLTDSTTTTPSTTSVGTLNLTVSSVWAFYYVDEGRIHACYAGPAVTATESTTTTAASAHAGVSCVLVKDNSFEVQAQEPSAMTSNGITGSTVSVGGGLLVVEDGGTGLRIGSDTPVVYVEPVPGTPVTVNSVHVEPGFLPHPPLPPWSPTAVPAEAGTIWQWNSASPVAFHDVRTQVVFWASVPDSLVGAPNRWIARLFVDDELVSATPPAGTLLPGPADASVQEYRLVLPRTSFTGSVFRLELEAAPGESGKILFFDSVKTPSRVEMGNAETTVSRFDANGNAVHEMDGAGEKQEHEYDGFDRRTGTAASDGSRMQQSFDAAGRVTLEEAYGPVGGVGPARSLPEVLLSRKARTYDEAGRLVREGVEVFTPGAAGTPGVESRAWKYDAAGRLVVMTDFNSANASYEYDALGRRTAEENALGDRIESEYDAAGNLVVRREVVWEDHGSGPVQVEYETLYAYDAEGNRIRETDPLGGTRRFGHDSRGNLVWESDATGALIADPDGLYVGPINDHGNFIHYAYDDLGNLVQTDREIRAGGVGTGAVIDTVTTAQTWTPEGRIASRTDDTGHTTQYEYDSLGRLVREVRADGAFDRLEYDLEGHLTRIRDASGNDIRQSYVGDLLVRREVAAGNLAWSTVQTFEYDGLGRLTRATDNNDPADSTDDAVFTRSYDSVGRVLDDVQNGRGVGHAYTGINVGEDLVYPSGRTVTTEFDLLGRASRIEDASGTLYEYAYEGARVKQRLLGNGAVIDLAYDGAQRLVGIQESGSAAPLPVGFDYAYDRMDRPSSQDAAHTPSLAQTHSYDSLGRLVGVQRNLPGAPARPAVLAATLATGMTWGLDGAHDWSTHAATGGGQPRSETRTHNDVHELTSITNAGVTVARLYDDNGNQVTDGSLVFEWDAFNRLRRVTDAATSQVIAKYDYDAEDRRIKKQVPAHGFTRHYVYDAEDVLAEYDHQPALSLEFVHGPGYDEPLVMDTSSQRYFYIHDALGSVVALSHSNGDHLLGYVYEPYGKSYAVGHGSNVRVDWGGDDVLLTSINPGVFTAQLALQNPYGFTGQRWDWETGLLYYKARYYDPVAGRFISRDPIGAWTDAVNLGNAYAYVASSPGMNTDPTGEWCRSVFGNRFCNGSNNVFCEGASGRASGFLPFVHGFCNVAAHGDICDEDMDMSKRVSWQGGGKEAFMCGVDFGLGFLDFIPGGGVALKTGVKGAKHGPDAVRAIREAVENLGRQGDEAIGGIRVKPKGPNPQVVGPAGLSGGFWRGATFKAGQLDAHLAKHAGEWSPALTKGQYLDGARDLLGSRPNGNILGHVRSNGDILRYNTATNEFAAGSADGYIRTFFRPTDGINYWRGPNAAGGS